MAHIKVMHDPVGETLTVYWDDPQREEVCKDADALSALRIPTRAAVERAHCRSDAGRPPRLSPPPPNLVGGQDETDRVQDLPSVPLHVRMLVTDMLPVLIGQIDLMAQLISHRSAHNV